MRHARLSCKAALLAGAAVTCLFCQPTVAQTAGQQTAQAGGGIEEVIVTARKREENLQSVPLAVTAVSSEFLQQHQITDITGLQSVVPSLQVQSGTITTGVPVFTIRGIGTNVIDSAAESSVGVVVDDVPIDRTELINVQFFDINNVQVLRGPQGMLFGKNASAGLINIVTNNPDFSEMDFIAHAEYGSMNTPTPGNTETIDVAGNIPISDDAAFRLTGFFAGSNGFIKNVYLPDQWTGSNQEGGRLKFLWEPTSRFRVLLSGDASREDGPGDGMFSYSYTTPYPPGVYALANAALGITASRTNAYQASHLPNKDGATTYGASLKADYDIGDGYTVTNIAAYRARANTQDFDSDAVPLDIGGSYFDKKPARQLTEELRLTSPTDQQFTFQAGFFYLALWDVWHATILGDFGAPPPPPPLVYLGFSQFYREKANSAAGYFEGNYKILDNLRLTAGMRYTHDWDQFASGRSYSPFSILHPFPAFSAPPASTEKDNVSARTSLDYTVAPDVMVYAGFGLGYKGPTFDETSLAVVRPEIPYDYELGLKSTLLNDRLRLNLAAFDQLFWHFQVQTISPFGAVETTNAKKLTDKGVELEATAIPVDGLTLTGGVTYISTAYTGVLLACYPGEPGGPGTNQCQKSQTNPAAGVYPSGVSNGNGDVLQDAPAWTETLTVRYERPVWDGWNGFIQGNGYFRSPFNFNVIKDPNTQVGASAILGLSMGATSDDGHVGFSVFVRNLTDKRVPVVISGASTTALVPEGHPPYHGDYFQQFDADSFRTIGVSLDYHL